MDEAMNRLAHELAEAIAAAVAHDPRVEACRQRARSRGFELRVTLEAVVGFTTCPTDGCDGQPAGARDAAAADRRFEVTASDRRFLRSLRIAADETKEEV